MVMISSRSFPGGEKYIVKAGVKKTKKEEAEKEKEARSASFGLVLRVKTRKRELTVKNDGWREYFPFHSTLYIWGEKCSTSLNINI